MIILESEYNVTFSFRNPPKEKFITGCKKPYFKDGLVFIEEIKNNSALVFPSNNLLALNYSLMKNQITYTSEKLEVGPSSFWCAFDIVYSRKEDGTIIIRKNRINGQEDITFPNMKEFLNAIDEWRTVE